jgi:hypothetical protein
MRDEHFSRYHLDRQGEAEEFTSALKKLLEQVPLQVNILEMLTHWKWFGEWSIGCVGIRSRLGDGNGCNALPGRGKSTDA